MAEAYGTPPDVLLDMAACGFSGTTRLQFNRAIFRLAGRIEGRARAEDPIWMTPEKPPSKGQVRSSRPRYRMVQLLAPGEDALDDEGPSRPVQGLPDLPTSGL
jgi:hypothetical protein